MAQSTGTSRRRARRLAKRQGCGSKKRSKPNAGACTRKPKPRNRLRCSVPLKPSAWRSSKRTNVLRSRKQRSAPPNPAGRSAARLCAAAANIRLLSTSRRPIRNPAPPMRAPAPVYPVAAPYYPPQPAPAYPQYAQPQPYAPPASGSGRTACTWPALEPG